MKLTWAVMAAVNIGVAYSTPSETYLGEITRLGASFMTALCTFGVLGLITDLFTWRDRPE